jgi:hypothetical protein
MPSYPERLPACDAALLGILIIEMVIAFPTDLVGAFYDLHICDMRV